MTKGPKQDDGEAGPKPPTAREIKQRRAMAEAERLNQRFPGGTAQVAAEVKARRRATVRAERERVADLGRAPSGVERGHDTGVPLQVERDRVELRRNALIPVDPDVKNGRTERGIRGQRVWAPDRLSQKGTITAHQLVAAERYLDGFEIGHEGARDRPVVIVARGPSVGLPGPGDRQLDALTRYRVATQRVGQAASGVLMWCVLRTVPPDQPPTVEAFARSMGKGWSTDRAVGLLIGALDALVAFYGVSGPTSGGSGSGRRRHTIAGHAGHGPPVEPARAPKRRAEAHA